MTLVYTNYRAPEDGVDASPRYCRVAIVDDNGSVLYSRDFTRHRLLSTNRLDAIEWAELTVRNIEKGFIQPTEII